MHRCTLTVIFSVLFLAGCASAPLVIPPKTEVAPGIYHRVEKGQTLWKISKMYNMELEELARVNHIADTFNVEVGQLLFIPFRQKLCPTPNKYVNDDFIWPLKGRVVGEFGVISSNMINKGINIQPYPNNPDVVAARSGRVVFYSPDFSDYGKTIIIDHGDGFLTVYARNAEVFVRVGEQVTRGNIIAKTGFTGRDKSTYLHFQIRKGYTPQNPKFYLP